MVRHLATLLAGTVLFAAAAAQPAAKKLPVPGRAAQDEAEKVVLEVFPELAKERRPDALRRLAVTLLTQGLETEDNAANRFVLLRLARDTAARAADARTALDAAAALGRSFVIDLPAMQVQALAAAEAAADERTSREVALVALDHALLVAADSLDAANRALAVAGRAARKSKLARLAGRVAEGSRKARSLAEIHKQIKPAAAALKKDAADPDANLVLGRYHGLVRGDWETGLPLLARGRDAALKALAQRDLGRPAIQKDRLALADAWWDLGQKEEQPGQRHLRRRAAHWYRQVAAGLEGEAQARASGRLAVASGQLLEIKAHPKTVFKVAFTPDGRRTVSGSADNLLKVWDLDTGKEVLAIKTTSPVASVAVTPDGKHLLSGCSDGPIRMWDARTGAEVRTFAGHDKRPYCLAVSADGKRLLSAGVDDRTARVWDVAKGAELIRFMGHQESVLSVAFSPDGRHALSAGRDLFVRLWEVDTGSEVRRMGPLGSTASSVAVSPDGKRAVSGSYDKALSLWDVGSGKRLKQLEGHADYVHAVAFLPDGRRVLSGSGGVYDGTKYVRTNDNTVRLWDLESGRELHRFEGHTHMVLCVVVSPDGRTALSTGSDGTVRLWELPR